ncbi:NnrU family protein [uncultured Nitratireductor sp.]|uniref:NnrU family protein n=1 Tax=uncultured Nitratireductor sp. TaxID=520953 RepID=UPI0025F917C9|nr:NnrU family protein [uncultured Nitratireductor sp.]
MTLLVTGLALFLAVHSLSIVAPELRAQVMATHGKRAWLLPYTAISIVGFGLIVWGYGLARMEPAFVYAPPMSLRHLALLVLLPVFPLLIAAYVPSRIKLAVRHPMLLATILWGLAHLMANGTFADLVLFGGFTLWAAIDWVSVTNRPRKAEAPTPRGWRGDAIAVLGGLAAYGLFVAGLHQWLIGVSPL